MRKIGNTSFGTVIVEMTEEHFAALTKLQAPLLGVSPIPPKPMTALAPVKGSVASMTPTELVAYIGKKVAKQEPKKKDKLIHFIQSLFHLTGGIDDKMLEDVIASLQKTKVFTIDSACKVTYPAKQV